MRPGEIDFYVATQEPQFDGASKLLGSAHSVVDMRSDGRELAGSPLAFWMPDAMLESSVDGAESPQLANEPLRLGNMEALIP